MKSFTFLSALAAFLALAASSPVAVPIEPNMDTRAFRAAREIVNAPAVRSAEDRRFPSREWKQSFTEANKDAARRRDYFQKRRDGSIAKRQGRGSQQVPGLGKRKGQIMGVGGTSADMAVAMLESDTMQATYTYGDGKTGDSTNFGIFKQNWGMLRQCASQFKGLSAADSSQGAVLNTNLADDVKARHECYAQYGSRWFAGQRNGASGLQSGNTSDISGYADAVNWIQGQLDSNNKYLHDDTRFWVEVTAI